MSALLTARDLAVRAGRDVLVQGVSFTLEAGGCLTLLGESGSGKSLILQALMAALPAGLEMHGEVWLDGQAVDAAARRAAWGRRIAWLPQEPGAALDPTQRAAARVAEVYRGLHGRGAREAERAAAADLARLGLPPAAATRYPHQLSGGMAQRVALAATLAAGAPLLLADEPTKGLDAARRAAVVAQFQAVQAAGGAVLVITHDVALARALGGQVLVLCGAGVAEQGPAAQVLHAPRAAYTRELLAADPAGWPARAAAGPARDGPALVQGLGLTLARGGQTLFDGLHLAIHRGERWAIQGPSGAGKSSLGNLLLGLLSPDAGRVRRAPGLGPLAFQKLYQDPLAAFPPHVTLRCALDDLLRRHRLPWARLQALREALGLADGLLERRPQAVSGGELQRLALLRVMLLEPALLFADEPTSRLDPITQREVLALLQRQLDASGAALLLVTHDAALAAHVAERRIVLGPPASAPAAGPAAGRVPEFG